MWFKTADRVRWVGRRAFRTADRVRWLDPDETKSQAEQFFFFGIPAAAAGAQRRSLYLAVRAGPERALLQVGPSTLYLYYIIGGEDRGDFDACLVVLKDQVSDPRRSGGHRRLLGAWALGFCERAQCRRV